MILNVAYRRVAARTGTAPAAGAKHVRQSCDALCKLCTAHACGKKAASSSSSSYTTQSSFCFAVVAASCKSCSG